jgi:hypothetical protein
MLLLLLVGAVVVGATANIPIRLLWAREDHSGRAVALAHFPPIGPQLLLLLLFTWADPGTNQRPAVRCYCYCFCFKKVILSIMTSENPAVLNA